MRLIFTLGTSQPQGVHSCNFFPFIAWVHGALFLKTVKLWVVLNKQLNNQWRRESQKSWWAIRNVLIRIEKTRRQSKEQILGGPWCHGWVLESLCFCQLNSKPFQVKLPKLYLSWSNKLCHSMLTFICTTGRYSWLFLIFLDIDR